MKNEDTEYGKNKAAVRAAKESSFGEGAMSGGFNIVKKLFIKQHKKQKSKPSKKV